jgi:hypothetical protein
MSLRYLNNVIKLRMFQEICLITAITLILDNKRQVRLQRKLSLYLNVNFDEGRIP